MDAWALISVSDKEGLAPLAEALTKQGLKLLATGSTARYLTDQGFGVETVEALTGFGEILDGRVKTLHPVVYAGILASSSDRHQAERQALKAPDIRVVVVNLYPFERRWGEHGSESELVEEVDIGGVSLIRAAAKNFERVAVLVSPDQYPAFIERPLLTQDVEIRRRLAVRAFQHVARYDAVIAVGLSETSVEWPEEFVLAGRLQGSLRYGENPHLPGALYQSGRPSGFAAARVLQGKALSYNNYADADTAWRLAADFEEPAAVVGKHQTPCAAALGESIEAAYQRAHDADPVSIFGGIVAVNRPVTAALAQKLTSLFLEVVLAPGVTADAKTALAAKKNLRVIVMPAGQPDGWDLKGIWGGFLVQPQDRFEAPWGAWRHAGGPPPNPLWLKDMELAWKTVARAKSNAIVVARDGATLGIGSGETNRIDAARHAVERAGEAVRGAVLASDGFFPFDDVMRLCQECGIAAAGQPGGAGRGGALCVCAAGRPCASASSSPCGRPPVGGGARTGSSGAPARSTAGSGR